jgi:hypothetical protein
MANPHIKIRRITGGSKGDELKKLHFQETSSDNNKFHLFKGDEQIHTEPEVLTSGKDFDFVYNDLCWSITQFWISEKDQKSTGNWFSRSCAGSDDPETGTFQAQAGPGAERKIKTTASGAAK